MLFEILAQATVTPTATTTPTTNYGWLEFIRDPFWQAIGAITAVIIFIATIIFTLWLARKDRVIARIERQQAEKERQEAEKERNRSELTPILLANTPLITIKEEDELQGRLVITFDGKEMKEPNIHTLLMQFVNTGNKPIDDDFFSGPIRIDFEKDSEVLTASVVRTEPDQFDAIAEPDPTDSTRVLIHPVLLNEKQSITVKVLIRNAQEPKPTIYAHIMGVQLQPMAIGRLEKGSLSFDRYTVLRNHARDRGILGYYRRRSRRFLIYVIVIAIYIVLFILVLPLLLNYLMNSAP